MSNTIDELNTFAEILYEPDDVVEIRPIRNNIPDHQEWAFAKDLPDRADTLLRHNGNGYNIYAGANPRKAKGLTGNINVPLARCLFADFDHIETSDGESVWDVVRKIIEKSGLPSPTLVINSGHGVHTYWKLSKPIRDMAEWRRLQESLINVLGSDPVIKNEERIMRSPGFLNTKREPLVPCYIIEIEKARVYSVEDIEAIEAMLQIPQETKGVNLEKYFNKTKTETISDQDRALECLASLRTFRADDYGLWLNVGMALHHCGVNCSVWDEWSKQSLKYKPGECGKKWETFGKGTGYGLTLGSLMYMAEQDDPGFKTKKTANFTTTTSSITATTPRVTEATNVTEPTTPESIFDGVSDVYESIINGKRQAIKWPWPQLSKLSQSLINGSITVLCGSPGSSKSFMILQACLHWFNAGIKVALYALEEDREFHLMRVLAQETGKPELSPSGMDWIKEHRDEVRKIILEKGSLLGFFGQHIWERQNTTMTLVEAANWIEERAKESYRIIIVDPITIVESDKPWIDDKKFIGTVGKIATDYGCSVIVVSHPVKAVSGPDMSQLAGSTAYTRFSQNILWLHCESEDNQNQIVRLDRSTELLKHNRTLHILKSRHGRGSGTKLAMNFNNSLRLEELGMILSEGQGSNHQEHLDYRADKRAEKAHDDKETALAKERAAREKRAAVEASERGKTERLKKKLEAKTMLTLDKK